MRREKEERQKGHGQLNKAAIAWAMRLTRCEKEAERQRGRGAHNEHMQCDVWEYGEATRKCTSIYLTSKSSFCHKALSTAKANEGILLIFTRSLTSQ